MTGMRKATCWSAGLAMVQDCDQAGANLLFVKQNRRNSTLQLFKQTSAGWYFWARHRGSCERILDTPAAVADWRGTWEPEVGAFMNQVSQCVDLLGWIVGPVDSKIASIRPWRATS